MQGEGGKDRVLCLKLLSDVWYIGLLLYMYCLFRLYIRFNFKGEVTVGCKPNQCR